MSSDLAPPPPLSRQLAQAGWTCYTERRKTREKEGSAHIAKGREGGGLEPKRTKQKSLGIFPQQRSFIK
jgi:hypothetical protein